MCLYVCIPEHSEVQIQAVPLELKGMYSWLFVEYLLHCARPLGSQWPMEAASTITNSFYLGLGHSLTIARDLVALWIIPVLHYQFALISISFQVDTERMKLESVDLRSWPTDETGL